MELYSAIGDHVLVGRIVRKVVDEDYNIVYKADFGIMKNVHRASDLKLGHDESLIIISDSDYHNPRIVYGPIETKVLRRQYEGRDNVVKQIILFADSFKKITDRGMRVSQADALDFEIEKIERQKKEAQRAAKKVVIKCSKSALAKRELLLAASMSL